MMKNSLLWSLVLLAGFVALAGGRVDDDRAAIDAVLTDFHQAAHEGDFDRYFAHFTEDAIFFGTDPAERWTVEEFKDYAREPMADGHGWTYHMRERHIFIRDQTAWFDEVVESDHYGRCRGTGVLVNRDGAWKIAQYNLVIPVPNDFADEVVAATRRGLSEPKTIVIVRHAEKGEGDDPSLNEMGYRRVERLRRMLREFEFDAVYASDTTRARQTVAPFAQAAKVDMSIVAPAETAARLKADDFEQAIVAGHSNTVPDLLRELGVETDLKMTEREYDRLFIVRLDELGRPEITHLRY